MILPWPILHPVTHRWPPNHALLRDQTLCLVASQLLMSIIRSLIQNRSMHSLTRSSHVYECKVDKQPNCCLCVRERKQSFIIRSIIYACSVFDCNIGNLFVPKPRSQQTLLARLARLDIDPCKLVGLLPPPSGGLEPNRMLLGQASWE